MILSTILAALLTLAPGYDNTGAAGEVVAVSAATHFGQAAITNKVLLGGGVLVTGAADGDIIKIIIK